MEDYLVEAKQEYTTYLVTVLTPSMFSGFVGIFEQAKTIVNGNSVYKNFQLLLQNVPTWNNYMLEKEVADIVKETGCSWLDDLLTAVFVSHSRILASVKVGNYRPKNKKIDLKIPDTTNFVHHCYIQAAREFYKNPMLFVDDRMVSRPDDILKNHHTINHILKEAICSTIRKLLPFKDILNQYLALEDNNHHTPIYIGGNNNNNNNNINNNNNKPNTPQQQQQQQQHHENDATMLSLLPSPKVINKDNNNSNNNNKKHKATNKKDEDENDDNDDNNNNHDDSDDGDFDVNDNKNDDSDTDNNDNDNKQANIDNSPASADDNDNDDNDNDNDDNDNDDNDDNSHGFDKDNDDDNKSVKNVKGKTGGGGGGRMLDLFDTKLPVLPPLPSSNKKKVVAAPKKQLEPSLDSATVKEVVTNINKEMYGGVVGAEDMIMSMDMTEMQAAVRDEGTIQNYIKKTTTTTTTPTPTTPAPSVSKNIKKIVVKYGAGGGSEIPLGKKKGYNKNVKMLPTLIADAADVDSSEFKM